MLTTTPWTCPSCNASTSGAYCPDCGECRPSSRDLTLRGLFWQIFHAFSSIDGRLLRSFRVLLTRPGELSAAYVRGQRVAYLGPLQIFIIANALFFATQSLTHWNVVGALLDAHLHQQDWRALAQTLVERRLAAKGMTLEAYAPLFDRAVVLNAKSLIVMMTLPFALLLPVSYLRSRQPFVAHFVFSLHFFAFVLLLFCVELLIGAADAYFGGGGLASRPVDITLSIVTMLACAAYLHVASGVFYRAKGVMRVARAAILAVALGVLVVGYRFLMFLITLYTT
jgi:hypothetical protein